ncbi:glycosyltransferase [Parafrankia sp. EAN1pec]|uniref:glycosyltransferase n=1 Tax=Parafrankia sp. (strain EAN1pec) TaxID=298653 RepID=UPI0026B8E42C
MRVFGWAADASACGYYRLGLPLEALKARGHRTLVSTVLPAGWLDADIIVGQRVCMPEPSQTWQRLARDGHLLVYEIDDNLFGLHPTNPGRRLFGDSAVQQRVRDNAAVASLVTVTTEALAQVMREINPNVVVLPNRIPGWLLIRDRPRRQRLTVGWAGSATHYADIAEIASPLRPHVFNRSKSPLRVLEVAALGIPAVASEYGPYEDFVRPGETGFLVRCDHEWVTYLRELAGDRELREVLVADVRTLALPAADMVILGDVLEHMASSEAVDLWGRARAAARRGVLASLPVVPYPQGLAEGNPFEAHVEEWSDARAQAVLPGVVAHDVDGEIGVYLAGPAEEPACA